MLRERVVVPALLSVLTGVFVGAVVLSVSVLRHQEDVLAVSLVAFTLTTSITWLGLLRRSSGEGDEVVSSVPYHEPEPEGLRLAIEHQDGRGEDWLNLPVKLPQLVAMSERLMNGGSFGYSSLSGRNAIFTRDEFEQVRDAFVSAGLAKWQNEQAHTCGLVLSGSGRAVVRRFASMTEELPQLERTVTMKR